MKKILPYFHGNWLLVCLAPTFKFFEAVFELLTPLVVTYLVDTCISTKDIQGIYMCLGLMLGFGIAGLGFSIACQYMASRAGSNIACAVRSSMLKHIQRIPLSQLDRQNPASLTQRLTNDVNQFQHGISMGMRLLTRSPFMIIGATVGAIIISPLLSTIFLGVGIIISITLYFILKITTPRYTLAAKRTDIVLSHAKSHLSGSKVIRAYDKKNDEQAAAKKSILSLAHLQNVTIFISSLLNPIAITLTNLGIIAVLFWGGFLMNGGDATLTTGKILALINYLTQIQLSLVVLAMLLVTFSRTGASIRRINNILDIPTSPSQDIQSSSTPDYCSPAIEFEHVNFSYHETVANCLTDINFTLDDGERLGIIGGTGSGKSTILNVLTRSYPISSGCIKIFGNSIDTYDKETLLYLLGVVPQAPSILFGTVRSNINWKSPNATDDELNKALKTSQCLEFVKKMPKGLDSEIQEAGHNLSGGQKQRLTIARALVGEPKILTLDDASSALDATTDRKLRAALKKQKITTIIISQRVSAISDCDRILVLDKGEVVAFDDHTNLLITCPLYKEIVSSQATSSEEK